MRFSRWWLPLMAALVVGAPMLPGTARAGAFFGGSYRSSNVAVDVSYFYDELAPYGDWVDYGSYGWCWAPEEISASWRPYSNGHWIYTDYGWTWASYEPWGWAVYHYGRWVFDADYGWLWVPGTDWGPAWVAWRSGYDYCGWAPLPPDAGWSVSVGLEFGSSYYDRIPNQGWCFVPETRILDTDLRSRIVSWDRNRNLLPRTRDYTRFRSAGGWPVNVGVPVNQVERTMGRNVPRLRVTDLESPGRGHGVVLGRNAVGFFRPRLRDGNPRVAPREDARLAPRGRSAERGGLFDRGGRGGGFAQDRTRGAGPRPEMGRQREVTRPGFGRQQEIQRQRDDRQRDVERQRGMERQRDVERQRGMERQRDVERQRGVERQRDVERQRGVERRQDIERGRSAPQEWTPRPERREAGRERGGWQRGDRPDPGSVREAPRPERPQSERPRVEERRSEEPPQEQRRTVNDRGNEERGKGDRGDRGNRGGGRGRK